MVLPTARKAIWARFMGFRLDNNYLKIFIKIFSVIVAVFGG